jgi:hypothetical protein
MITEGKKLKFPWVLFHIDGNTYAISSEKVVSLAILKEITYVPKAPDSIRGLTNLRGKIISLIDLRKKLGRKSVPEEISEFAEMLAQRKQEHIHWLNELENSVKENRPFQLTTDPHACAFGKWFDNFHSTDIVLNTLLRKIDRTHQYIHSIAIRIQSLQEQNKYSEAEQILVSTRNNELKLLIELLTSLVQVYRESRHEIILILEHVGITLGVIADDILSVEQLLEDSLSITYMMDSDPNMQMGKRKDDSPVILLHSDYFFAGLSKK